MGRVNIGGRKPVGTAGVNDVLAGKTFSNSSGVNLSGTMPYKSGGNYEAVAFTAGNGLVYLRPPKGYYDEVGYWVYALDPDFDPANYRADKNIFGQQGSIPVHVGTQNAGGTNAYDGQLYLLAPTGFYNGSIYVVANDPDFVSPNILETANLFGKQGSAVKREYASGPVTSSSTTEWFTVLHGGGNNSSFVEVSGLTFTPSMIVIEYKHANNYIYRSIAYKGSLGAYSPNICMTSGLPETGDPATSAYIYKNDVAPAYITNGGFKLPFIIGGVSCTYKAWK